jgi:predicted ribonuclease YlaK
MHLLITGAAGTGKTYEGLRQAFARRKANLTIIRSAVPTRDIGFLPGDEDDKTKPFFDFYKPIIKDLKHNGVKTHNRIKTMTTSFLRGETLDGVVMLDEAQNCSFHELYTVLSRISDTATLIIIGDDEQSDLPSPKEFIKFARKYKDLRYNGRKLVHHLHMTENHRSKLLEAWRQTL